MHPLARVLEMGVHRIMHLCADYPYKHPFNTIFHAGIPLWIGYEEVRRANHFIVRSVRNIPMFRRTWTFDSTPDTLRGSLSGTDEHGQCPTFSWLFIYIYRWFVLFWLIYDVTLHVVSCCGNERQSLKKRNRCFQGMCRAWTCDVDVDGRRNNNTLPRTNWQLVEGLSRLRQYH